MNLLCKLILTLNLSLVPFFYAQANAQYVTNDSDQRYWTVTHSHGVNEEVSTAQWLEPGGLVVIHNNDQVKWDDDTRDYGRGQPYIVLYQNEGDENNPEILPIGQFGLRVTLQDGYTSIFASCYYESISQPNVSVNFTPGEAIGVYQWYDCREGRIENWPAQ